jgi:hypothetical protein
LTIYALVVTAEVAVAVAVVVVVVAVKEPNLRQIIHSYEPFVKITLIS